MAKTTYQVAYKYLAVNDDPNNHQKNKEYNDSFNKLKEYAKVSSIAADVFTDFFLNICGAMTPETTKYSRYLMPNVEDNKQKKLFHIAPTLFLNWFTYESKIGADKSLVIEPQNIMPIFLQHCKKYNVELTDKWIETIRATVFSASEEDSKNKVWVNRIAGFSKLQKETKISQETALAIFNNPKFVLQENPIDSANYSRSFFSDFFGEGEKADWNFVGKLTKELYKFLEYPADKILLAWREFLNIPNDSKPKDVNAIFKTKGNPNTLSRLLSPFDSQGNINQRGELAKTGKFKKEDFLKILDERMKLIEYKKNLNVSENESESILQYLKHNIGLDYESTFYGEFFSQSLQRIKSYRSNSINKMQRRYDIDITKPIIDNKLEDSILKWMENTKQDYLTYGDVGLINQVEELFDGKIEEAINKAEKKKLRINIPFLKMASLYFDNHWFKSLKEYQKFSKNKYDFNRLRMETLARFAYKHNHPCYGESRPTAKFDVENSIFTMQILGKNGVENIKIKVANKRAAFDFRNDNGTVEAPRRTKLTGLDMDVLVKQIKPNGILKGNKLYIKDNKVYIISNYELLAKKMLSKEEIKEMRPGWKYLSIDPGIRQNLSYSLWESYRESPSKENLEAYVNENNIPCVKIANGKWIRCIETGQLIEEDFKNNNKTYCRISSCNSKIVEKEEREYWKFLSKLGIVKKEIPEEYHTFIKESLFAIKKYCYDNEDLNIEVIGILDNIVKNKSRQSGNLSYERILNLIDFKRIYQSFLSKFPNEQWLVDSLAHSTKKILQTRRSRCERTVNLICQKAIKEKVKVVVLEKTGLDVHSSLPKYMKRKIDIWTPRRIRELAKTTLNNMGIYVIEKSAEWTSHSDFAFSNVKRARYSEMKNDRILKEILYWKEIKNPIGTKSMYLDEVKSVLATIGVDFSSNITIIGKDMKFPDNRGGSLFPSKLLGWINADINASMFMLVDGLRYFLHASGNEVKSKKSPRMNVSSRRKRG